MKKLSPGQFVGAREGIEIEKEKEKKSQRHVKTAIPKTPWFQIKPKEN